MAVGGAEADAAAVGHLHDDDGTPVPAALFFVSPEMEMLGAWFRGAPARYSIYYAVYLL